jgi:rhodanese-related sulfurtransferase
MTALKSISPQRAAELMRNGAVLIDIREANEFARERIPGARHHALSQLDASNPAQPGDDVLVFHCRSGARTKMNAPRLAASAGNCKAYVLDGGIDAWKRAGLPTSVKRKEPIEIGRQMQIGAGGLVPTGVGLGVLVSPDFFALSGLVGLGPILAGITGYCGMTRLLTAMPWNRRSA